MLCRYSLLSFTSLCIFLILYCTSCQPQNNAETTDTKAEEDRLDFLINELYSEKYETMDLNMVHNQLSDIPAFTNLSESEKCKLEKAINVKLKCNKSTKEKFFKEAVKKAQIGGISWKNGGLIGPARAKYQSEVNRINLIVSHYYALDRHWCLTMKLCKSAVLKVECLRSDEYVHPLVLKKYEDCNSILTRDWNEKLSAALGSLSTVLEKMQDNTLDKDAVKSIANAELNKLELIINNEKDDEVQPEEKDSTKSKNIPEIDTIKSESN